MPANGRLGHSTTHALCPGSPKAEILIAGVEALESIKAGKVYYGEVPILGTPYTTGYEPIKDSSGAQIGVYYVGYKK